MKNGTLLALALAIFLYAPTLGGRQVASPASLEQTRFSMEQGISRPVSLPDEVFELLKKDKNALEDSVACTEKGGGRDVFEASWFTASEVHLGKPNEIDLLS